MQAVTNYLRVKGVQIWVYLDDFLIISDDYERTAQHTSLLLSLLLSLGLEINWDKSITNPAQTIQYLGFTLNLESGLVQIPTKKLSSIISDLVALHRAPSPTVRKLAAVLGRLRSLLFALPHARLLSDHMLNLLNQYSLQGWDLQLTLSPVVHDQICSTIEILKIWRGRKFIHELPMETLFTDSRTRHWGRCVRGRVRTLSPGGSPARK